MCDVITHRGPDDHGQFVAGPVGLGMRRLSIIDLAGGHQPIANPAGTLTIVFNGEIFNYRDVRHQLEQRGYQFRTDSDTESILHAYDEFGIECLSLLNGMFAFAIWDAPRRRLFIARDRLGVKPLYFRIGNDSVQFASEIKSLLLHPEAGRSIDPEALAYFFRYGYVAAPKTLHADVQKLPAAHYLLVEDGQVSIRRFWSVSYPTAFETRADHPERIRAAVDAAVRRQMIADVPLGAFLSGGVDSSSIVHFMSAHTSEPVNTYSIGFTGDDAFHSELDDARFMAQALRTNHHEIVVKPDVANLLPRLVAHLDEPLADSSFVVTYLVSTLARDTVKVILSGVGGDELFGGYRRYLFARLNPYFEMLPAVAKKALTTAVSHMPVDRGSRLRNYARLGRAFVLAQGLSPFEQYDHSVRILSDADLTALLPHAQRDGALLAARRDVFTSASSDPITAAMHLDLETSLPESLLLLTDKMSMAASLEARVPFLDHELVEAAAMVPTDWKVRGTRLRYVQKESMRNLLPNRVLDKRKRGFGFPIGSWFRRDLRSLLNDLLSADRLRRQGLFDPSTVQGLMAAHAEHRHDHSDVLLALLTFQLWLDR